MCAWSTKNAFTIIEGERERVREKERNKKDERKKEKSIERKNERKKHWKYARNTQKYIKVI